MSREPGILPQGSQFRNSYPINTEAAAAAKPFLRKIRPPP
jgi:hypothetical protein